MFASFVNFLRLIVNQRDLILSMAKRQVATQHVGSLLGFVWTFINPMVMIGVFWFVFSVGFRVQPVKDVPFVVWLTAGLAIWNLFAIRAVFHHLKLNPTAIFDYRKLLG